MSDKKTTPTLTDHLLEAFNAYYQPCEPTHPAAEYKSTNDITNEMENIAHIEQGIVATALVQKGFKIHYTATGPQWVLKPKA